MNTPIYKKIIVCLFIIFAINYTWIQVRNIDTENATTSHKNRVERLEEIKPLLNRNIQTREQLSNHTLDIPVVYMYFCNEQDHEIPQYAIKCMITTASHGNRVTLITSPRVTLSKEAEIYNIQLRDMMDFQSEELRQFRKVYRHWGIKEPWEQQNTERFFILAQYMKNEELSYIFFADSDVAVLTRVSYNLLQGSHKKCDSMLSLQHNDPVMKWQTVHWAAWAGTSILERSVLEDFANFAIQMYQGKFIKLLEWKRDNWPYVCDMTLWYLFVGASDTHLAKIWEWKKQIIPKTNQHHFCDILELGFAHVGGYKKEWNTLIPTHQSVHFQGWKKDDAMLLTITTHTKT
jgi:hypothetical protein